MKKSKRKGFGSALIKSGISGATVRHEMAPGGVVCTIEMPVPKAIDNAAAGTSRA